MSMAISAHARRRMQQRGISPQALELLLDLGHAAQAPGGRQVVFVERAERKELGRRAKRIRGRDRLKRLYAITDEAGAVITVGHRYRRLARVSKS
jgi:Domain of unknown function (DUF4258)